jgi:hypothetical protein
LKALLSLYRFWATTWKTQAGKSKLREGFKQTFKVANFRLQAINAAVKEYSIGAVASSVRKTCVASTLKDPKTENPHRRRIGI